MRAGWRITMNRRTASAFLTFLSLSQSLKFWIWSGTNWGHVLSVFGFISLRFFHTQNSQTALVRPATAAIRPAEQSRNGKSIAYQKLSSTFACRFNLALASSHHCVRFGDQFLFASNRWENPREWNVSSRSVREAQWPNVGSHGNLWLIWQSF